MIEHEDVAVLRSAVEVLERHHRQCCTAELSAHADALDALIAEQSVVDAKYDRVLRLVEPAPAVQPDTAPLKPAVQPDTAPLKPLTKLTARQEDVLLAVKAGQVRYTCERGGKNGEYFIPLSDGARSRASQTVRALQVRGLVEWTPESIRLKGVKNYPVKAKA